MKGVTIMTYEEFKEECYRIRDLRQERESILLELVNLDEHKFEKVGAGVIDTSREFTKRSKSTDEKMIEALSTYDEKREALLHKLETRPEINEELEDLLMDTPGTAGIIIFYYLLQNKPMKIIAQGLNHTPKYCFNLMNNKLRDLYHQYCERVG
jgi:hypothetical protein